MILSERGAIRSAIAEGGFHLYPAGKLVDLIKTALPGDELKDNFDPKTTPGKISDSVGATGRSPLLKDIALLRERLSSMDVNYDIESVFNRIKEVLPALAKRYYSIDDFKSPEFKVVEYYFEGYNDFYKDGDWNAFNVDHNESREMNIPMGSYFKRDQVSPGQPEYIVLHEANHAMQEIAMLHKSIHHYVPWMNEGFADAFARMMLFRATGDEKIIAKMKNFKTEVEVGDPRKVTYHYGEQTSILLMLRGRLPFVKALMSARQRDPFSIDWDALSKMVRSGWDPHIAVVSAFRGGNVDAFRKRLEREETKYRKESDFDQMDLKILSMFLATEAPACIGAAEYNAALWLTSEIEKRPSPYFVDPMAIPENLRPHVEGWKEDEIIPASKISSSFWHKVPELNIKICIREDDIPAEHKDAVKFLSISYFILKRQIGNTVVYEPYGGGLPYRLNTGEIRCGY